MKMLSYIKRKWEISKTRHNLEHAPHSAGQGPISSLCQQLILHFPDFQAVVRACFCVLASAMWVEGILATSRLGPKSLTRFSTFTFFAFQQSEHWQCGCVPRARRPWYDQKERGSWVAGKRVLTYKNQGSWSRGGEAIGGMLSHIPSGLPVGAFVPTYTPLQKCTSWRDFHGQSNRENYHQADNVSGKKRTTIRISSRG